MLHRCARVSSRCAPCTRAFWSNVPMGPPDKILGLSEAFNKDTFEKKTNLGVGAYRDANGKPYVLNSVRKAEAKILAEKMNHEYAGIVGVPGFNKLAAEFVYGNNSPALIENRVAIVQALSGTGACRLGAEFVSRFLGKNTPVYVPNPTWGNHIPLLTDAGLQVKKYRYYNPVTCGLDYEGFKADVAKVPNGSFFLIHTCAHNPTGVDPTPAQWDELSVIFKEKGHLCLFDTAYQGFASGDAERDAYSLRKFVSDGHSILVAQSFAKNFGLYGERIGALSVVGSDSGEAERILSQLKILIRPMYSNPPIYGARVVEKVLSDDALKAEWREECRGMAHRIIDMRTSLVRHLTELGSSRSWQHISDQIGMFCFTGLTPEQVQRMVKEFHIYITDDGRISMAGVTEHNVEYLAQSMHQVTK